MRQLFENAIVMNEEIIDIVSYAEFECTNTDLILGSQASAELDC